MKKNNRKPLPIEFDHMGKQFKAVGENYQVFVRLISSEVERRVPFHYSSWEAVPGDLKKDIYLTLYVSIECNVLFVFQAS